MTLQDDGNEFRGQFMVARPGETHEPGAGVIVVTHDHRAFDVFDRTVEMDDARL